MAKTKLPKNFWTHQRRLLIFKSLFERFGPFAQWGHTRHPAGKEKAFNQCLQQIADELEEESGLQVEWTKLKNQVQFAIGSQRRRSELKNDGYWNNLVGNKQAAFEAGLITQAEMPIDDPTKGAVVPLIGQAEGNLSHRGAYPVAESAGDEPLLEGAVQRVELDEHERNPKARKQCIEHYGANCCVCGFNFETAYGHVAAGFIEVHHLTPLSETCAEHVVDPVRDMRPACPNCHAVLHMRTPPFGIEEVQAFLVQRRAPS